MRTVWLVSVLLLIVPLAQAGPSEAVAGPIEGQVAIAESAVMGSATLVHDATSDAVDDGRDRAFDGAALLQQTHEDETAWTWSTAEPALLILDDHPGVGSNVRGLGHWATDGVASTPWGLLEAWTPIVDFGVGLVQLGPDLVVWAAPTPFEQTGGLSESAYFQVDQAHRIAASVVEQYDPVGRAEDEANETIEYMGQCIDDDCEILWTGVGCWVPGLEPCEVSVWRSDVPV